MIAELEDAFNIELDTDDIIDFSSLKKAKKYYKNITSQFRKIYYE